MLFGHPLAAFIPIRIIRQGHIAPADRRKEFYMSMYKKQDSYGVYKDKEKNKYYVKYKLNGKDVTETISKEIYDACKRENWRIAKVDERRKRCINPDGTRCKKTSCAECEKIQKIDIEDPCNGLPRSLDEMEESGSLMPISKAFISPEDYLIQQEIHQDLYTAIDALDETDQDLIILYYFEELKERQIGTVLNMKQKTVNNHKNNCLKKMKKFLTKNQ